MYNWEEASLMANPSITIPLDPQTAKAYDAADPDQKRKIQVLLSVRLELAVSARADYIITGDDDLKVLHPFQGIQILSPHAFLQSFACE